MAGPANSTQSKLFALQKEIFRSLRKESERLLGALPSSIRAYEKEWSEDFPSKPSASALMKNAVSKKNLIRQIRSHDVTFIGDYHPFAQAQRTALRLMREAVREGESWAIGLEIIPSQFQVLLDAFQSGRLSKEEFLKTIRYEEMWGFPWKNYEPIIHWAIESGIPLVALNRPKELTVPGSPDVPRQATIHEKRELHERDRWAAGVITDLFHAHQTHTRKAGSPRSPLRMIVLYGELHIARAHLPAHLHRISKRFLGGPLASVSIHQNHDELYWKLAEKHPIHRLEGVRLKNETYCVFSSTPWSKLESLVNWVEGHALEEDVDYLYLFGKYGKSLAEFFSVPEPSYEGVHIKTIETANFAERLSRKTYTPSEIQLIRYLVRNNFPFYLPKGELAYLGAPSQNWVAEIAARHLQNHLIRSAEACEDAADEVSRLVLQAAFGFYGSLVLNPKRKCDLIEDHVKRIRKLRSKKAVGFPLEREARELSVALLKNPAPTQKRLTSVTRDCFQRKTLQPALVIGTRYVGQVLAKRLHDSVIEGRIESTTVTRLFLHRPRKSESYFDRYLEVLRLTSRAKLPETKSAQL